MVIRRVICLFIVVSMLSGCSAQSRLLRLKEKNENVVSMKIAGSLTEVKALVRESAKELNLKEVKELEQENFIGLKYASVGKLFMVATLGLVGHTLAGGASTPTKSLLGIFFQNDQENNIVTITISEEVSSVYLPLRHSLIEKIKQKLDEVELITK